jgi:hypothetical protein
MCSRSRFHCPTGEHHPEPGKIHSGYGAINDYQWDCPNCRGTGCIEVSLLDRICVYIYERGRKVHRKLHPHTT